MWTARPNLKPRGKQHPCAGIDRTIWFQSGFMWEGLNRPELCSGPSRAAEICGGIIRVSWRKAILLFTLITFPWSYWSYHGKTARQTPKRGWKWDQPEEIPLDGRADPWFEPNHPTANEQHTSSCQGQRAPELSSFPCCVETIFTVEFLHFLLIRGCSATPRARRMCPPHPWAQMLSQGGASRGISSCRNMESSAGSKTGMIKTLHQGYNQKNQITFLLVEGSDICDWADQSEERLKDICGKALQLQGRFLNIFSDPG